MGAVFADKPLFYNRGGSALTQKMFPCSDNYWLALAPAYSPVRLR